MSASASPILLGNQGGLDRMRARLAARARAAVESGFACATLELPGSGVREPLDAVDRARADLHRALAAGEPLDGIVDRLIPPLVDAAVPEFQALLDALYELPGIDGPAGTSGGITAIAVRLARVDPRIVCAVLFAGSLLPAATFDDARELTIPLHVLLQWDDEGNDRQAALDLFDAFGSAEKTLNANMGGHAGVPEHAGAAASAFFERHLR
ncbi:alpha/beta hydrolase [Gordonia humi]|uniref:alpha/beta hydrolase n=1 Tax=Gordonia humi TaxID=686429 RepID=UPI003620BB40